MHSPAGPLVLQRLLDLYRERAADRGYRQSGAQESCLERLDALRRELAGKSANPSRGMYIYGDPGGGKTMLLDLFHEALVAKGIPSRRAHFHDFMIDVNRELHRIRTEMGGVSDPLARVAESFLAKWPVLCFDECHVLNVGDAMIMRAFFERLFAAGGTVVATSNLAPDKLYSSGINREVFQPFIDAVLRHCDAVELSPGQDFRQWKSGELAGSERSFFWPLGPAADAQLAVALETLRRSSEPPVATTVPVPMGRVLQCRRAWLNGVRAGEFSYEELCVAAVGTPDYLALCDAFDVIVLTGVPTFASSEEDAARRFASLVDVLYDRHKRLLCTIDGPPRSIFAAIRSQYSGGAEEETSTAPSANAIRIPTHGGGSGRHVSAFRLPSKAMSYTDSGRYGVSSDSQGSPGVAPVAQETWVEWSATGLKDASMFDLTCHTSSQQHDRLLPLLRCESRLEEMSYLQHN